MFRIYDEYGSRYPYEPRTYDMACRVAYFLRTMVKHDVWVVDSDTGRATSEVHYPDTNQDRYARNVARRLAA